jgi:hypothetical protein
MMGKMRILITDDSTNCLEAIEMLKAMKIDFFQISIDKISQSNFEVPTLLAPEGRFEGINLVKMYSKAEKNGFHKMIENPSVSY